MAKGRREKKARESSAALGWVLIALVVLVIALGAFGVWKGAVYWREKTVAQPETDEALQKESPAQEEREQPTAEPEEQPQPEQGTEPETQPEPEPEPEPERLTLMALGDNLIHNTIYWSAEVDGGGYDFTPFYEAIRPTVESYDIACINQETVLVDDPALYGNYPAFGTPEQVGDALAGAGFDVITQATNHCYDKGETGILSSIAFWRENYPEITLLGIHDSEEDAQTLRVVEKNGIRVAMLNYTYGLNYGAPTKGYMVDTLSSRDEIGAEIRDARARADFVIVFVHWGEEGSFKPTDSQKSWAQFFADQGVGLVVGSHPHVLQGVERFTGTGGNETPVFYSLGNFFCHQVDEENMLGGMASVTLERGEDGVVRLTECLLKPTINVIFRHTDDAYFDYAPMLLEDYTEEIAARHRFEGCTTEYMWSLYQSATGASDREPINALT